MENLGIDAKLLIAQLVNFVLFFLIFKKFIAKPFMSFLNDEEKKEKEKQAITEKIRKQEEEYLMKEREFKTKIKKQADEEMKTVKEKAQRVREEMLTEAKKEAGELVIKAKKQIEEERAILERNVKNKVADLSIFIVTKALRDYLDTEEKEKLTKSILRNLPKDVLKYEN